MGPKEGDTRAPVVGVPPAVIDDGMTRGPFVVLPDLRRANDLRKFVEANEFAEVRPFGLLGP